MNKRVYTYLSLVSFLFLPVFGQNYELEEKVSNSHLPKESYGLFTEEYPLDIALSFDLTKYLRTKPKKEYLDARITFNSGKRDSVTRNIKLRTRGEFRNLNCSFAPIELNFKNVDFGYSDLNKISKIKVVPQCSNGSEYENYLLREYLIYKMYNILTDTSFRVRLLTINYIDTHKKRRPIKQYGFFIEPIEMLAARTNSIQIISKALNQKSIFPYIMDRVAIFNYMIGNYDWAVPNQHNIKVLKPLVVDPSNLGIAIPYDFDWSGLVNASYAVPAENAGISSVRTRLFTGICRTSETYVKDLEIFLEKKEEIYRLVNEFSYLNQNSREDIIGYLDGFYNMLVGRKVIISELTNSCKNF